jgi:hypothetical protein
MKIKEIHLVAFYSLKPRQGVRTEISGWMQNSENYQYDERIEFTLGLKTKDMQIAGIILNLNAKTVVRNKYNTEHKDFDTLFKYFLNAYPKYVINVMSQLDMAYLEQFIPKEELGTDNQIDSPKVEDESVQVN